MNANTKPPQPRACGACLLCGRLAQVFALFVPAKPWLWRLGPARSGTQSAIAYALCAGCHRRGDLDGIGAPLRLRIEAHRETR